MNTTRIEKWKFKEASVILTKYSDSRYGVKVAHNDAQGQGGVVLYSGQSEKKADQIAFDTNRAIQLVTGEKSVKSTDWE